MRFWIAYTRSIRNNKLTFSATSGVVVGDWKDAIPLLTSSADAILRIDLRDLDGWREGTPVRGKKLYWYTVPGGFMLRDGLTFVKDLKYCIEGFDIDDRVVASSLAELYPNPASSDNATRPSDVLHPEGDDAVGPTDETWRRSLLI